MNAFTHAAVAFVLGLATLTHLNAWAKDDVIIGGIAYEEVDRKELKNGEIMVQLKRKPAPASGAVAAVAAATPEVAAPPAVMASAPVASTAAAAPAGKSGSESFASLAKELDQTLLAAIADQATSTDSPGLTNLGVSAGDMNTPVTPKDFAAMIAKGTDYSGNVKEGVAMQLSPATLFFPDSIRGGKRYETDRAMQAWARTSLELATARSEDARIGQQVAAAITVGLVDGSDPRLFWEPLSDCAEQAMNVGGTIGKPFPTEAEIAAFNLRQDAAIKAALECYADYTKNKAPKVSAMWSEPRWYAGYSRAWFTGSGTRIGAAGQGPSMLWTSFSKGLSKAGASVRTQVQLAASRKKDLQVNDPNDESRLVDEDRTDLLMRLRFSRSRWSGFADIGLARVTTDGLLSSNVKRYGYGAEYQLSDTMWLVLGSVTERGFVSGEKRTLLNTGLRFGKTDKPVLGKLGE